MIFLSNPHILTCSGILILDTDQSELKNLEKALRNFNPDFLLV